MVGWEGRRSGPLGVHPLGRASPTRAHGPKWLRGVLARRVKTGDRYENEGQRAPDAGWGRLQESFCGPHELFGPADHRARGLNDSEDGHTEGKLRACTPLC